MVSVGRNVCSYICSDLLSILEGRKGGSSSGGRYLRLGGTDDGECISTSTLGGLGHAPPEKLLRAWLPLKLGALRSLLRSYLCPSATSPTKVYGESITAVRHDTPFSRHEVFQSL